MGDMEEYGKLVKMGSQEKKQFFLDSSTPTDGKDEASAAGQHCSHSTWGS
jgi:hypothetical protein